jgi:hypothetical protein
MAVAFCGIDLQAFEHQTPNAKPQTLRHDGDCSLWSCYTSSAVFKIASKQGVSERYQTPITDRQTIAFRKLRFCRRSYRGLSGRGINGVVAVLGVG